MPSQKSSKGTYCSKECYYESLRGKPPPNSGKGKLVQWSCKGCDTTRMLAPYIAKRKKYCSSKCFGKSIRGSGHPSWNGGHIRGDYQSHEYKQWRQLIIERDGYSCRECADKGIKNNQNLEVHHIYPVSQYPESTLDTDNGITLCRTCHSATKGKESERAEYYLGLLRVEVKYIPKDSKKSFKEYGNLIKRLYLETTAINKEIAVFIGCSVCTVAYIVKGMGLPNRFELSKNKAVDYIENPNTCKTCGLVLPYTKRNNKYCSNSCQFKDPNRIIGVAKIIKPNSGQFFSGRVVPEEDRKKISEKLTGIRRERTSCPHCGKEGAVGLLKRWHFNNCKQKGIKDDIDS